MIRIALLEDNKVQVELISSLLLSYGYEVQPFSTINQLMDKLASDHNFDLLLLDWHLPDGTAASIINFVRHNLQTQIPILIESADDEEQTIVHALELGADDYVAKPIRSQELIARINAQLRRYRIDHAHLVKIGLYLLDNRNKTLSLNGFNLELSNAEYLTVNYIFEHFDELISREDLLAHVWGITAEQDTRKVDTLISRLRKKINLKAEYGFSLETVHGLGYRAERTEANKIQWDV